MCDGNGRQLALLKQFNDLRPPGVFLQRQGTFGDVVGNVVGTVEEMDEKNGPPTGGRRTNPERAALLNRSEKEPESPRLDSDCFRDADTATCFGTWMQRTLQ